MDNIEVIDAASDFLDVANLVKALLIELDPSAKEEIESSDLESIAKHLLDSSKIWAFLARSNNENVGVITLHECASIYAGGVFGEISELYVKPEFRSSNIGELLLNAAIEKGKERNWKRIEVGSPPPNKNPRTIKFYEDKGFEYTGARLRRLI
ncbi:MAG: GNAT family N-acetyltransferase [Colwellia sp.]|nr:GNAT family N-acetyltransferase [Colwellia sp.]MCW8866134.1 GNAT family N-acetyltransferase [Colwellia sp.]MCW9082721.1 GNAT family N-acetyltransferase [Colwellia sp.]